MKTPFFALSKNMQREAELKKKRTQKGIRKHNLKVKRLKLEEHEFLKKTSFIKKRKHNY